MILKTEKILQLVAVFVVGAALSTLKSVVDFQIIVAYLVTIRYFASN